MPLMKQVYPKLQHQKMAALQAQQDHAHHSDGMLLDEGQGLFQRPLFQVEQRRLGLIDKSRPKRENQYVKLETNQKADNTLRATIDLAIDNENEKKRKYDYASLPDEKLRSLLYNSDKILHD